MRQLPEDHRFERRIPVSSSPQGLSEFPGIPLEKQMLRLSRPLFWLKYRSKGLDQTLKAGSSMLTQTGSSYASISRRLLNLGFFFPGGTEKYSYGCYSLGKPRLHSKSGKVVFNPNPNNIVPGFCNRLHCRIIHTLLYLPSDYRVACAANISEHLTIRWERDHHTGNYVSYTFLNSEPPEGDSCKEYLQEGDFNSN